MMIRTIRLAILFALAAALVYSAYAQVGPGPDPIGATGPAGSLQIADVQQTWFPVAPENTSNAVAIPEGTTYRLGTSACSTTQAAAWSAPITVAADTTFNPLSYPSGVFPFDDPCPGTLKVFQVLETASPQTLTVNGAAFQVPALPPPTAPTSIATPPGQTYAVTLSAIQSPPTTDPPWFGIEDLPASGANVSVESTQFTLTIGGVALTCTYASRSGAIYTLNCAVPAAQSTTQTTPDSTPQTDPSQPLQIPVSAAPN